APQLLDMGIQPPVEVTQPGHDHAVPPPGEPEVEAAPRTGAKLEHPLALRGRYAEDIADDSNRKQRAVRRDQVDRRAGVERVEQLTGDSLRPHPQPLHRSCREDPGDELAVPRVVGGYRKL